MPFSGSLANCRERSPEILLRNCFSSKRMLALVLIAVELAMPRMIAFLLGTLAARHFRQWAFPPGVGDAIRVACGGGSISSAVATCHVPQNEVSFTPVKLGCRENQP